MATPADEEMIGRNVAGKFLVETFLGGGAMGAVYMAYQKSIEKHVAIKVLHREFVTDSNFVSRFGAGGQGGLTPRPCEPDARDRLRA